MLILNKEDIQKVYSMSDAIADDKNALKLYSQGNSTIPLRTNIDVKSSNGQALFMPGYVSDKDSPALGIKIVSVFPDNINLGLPSVPATMITLDPKTGITNSILDGTYFTQLRTGAVQGAGTDLLANEDASIGALIGTGGQAITQLEAMLTVRDLQEVRIFDIDHDRCQQFTTEMSELFGNKFNVQLLAVSSAKEAVTGADIITSVTTSPVPTFDAADVKKGAHINGVGAYTPQMREIPKELIKKADNIIFDTMDGVLNEAGDFITPLEDGYIDKSSYKGELGQVLLGEVPARTSHDEITIFKTVGTAVMDIYVAQRILTAATQKNIGNKIEF